ncbi:hypothetical protein ABZY45_31610 [Streptomyces sp. NPDC006516]
MAEMKALDGGRVTVVPTFAPPTKWPKPVLLEAMVDALSDKE